MKAGYDHFEVTRQVPSIAICNRRYHVNVEWNGGRLNPRGQCPRFRSGPIVPFVAQPGALNQRAKAPGQAPFSVPAHQASIDQSRGYTNSRMNLTAPRPRPTSIADLLRK